MVIPSHLALFGVSSQSEAENDEEFINTDEELRNPGYVFPEITTESFIDFLLPPLKKGITVKSVRSSLSKKGLTGFGSQWKGLWTVSGGKRRKKQDTFTPLVDIFRKTTSLVSAKMPHLEQVIDMIPLPTPERHGNLKRSLSSRDAYFVLKDRGEPIAPSCSEQHEVNSWDNIALTACYRRSSSEETRKQNARKVVSNIQLTMARDPSRRFAFGITVENTTMRLWFCSRSSPVVSKPFDFSKDLNTLTHIFLSLAFATKEEIGWDPTIQPFIRDDGRRVYRIDVDGEIYETSQALSKSSADELTGHATRVWTTHRLGSDVPYVLKDAWTEDDERPEHSVYEMLMHDIEAKYSAEVRKEVASHLLTPVAHCLVRVNGGEDDTTEVMMRGYIPSFKEKYRVNVEHLGSSVEDDDDEGAPPSTEMGTKGLKRGNLRDPLHWYNPVRKIRRRRHYRVVFKEVAKPLRAVRELSDVFTILSDSAEVLKWIHGAGWVHRDLSVGNLYLYQGRGLIGDLEYAKTKNSDLENELRIGTPDFMAVEAAKRCYVHLPVPDKDQLKAEYEALMEGRFDYAQKMTDARIPPPFFHNDLHDLESLWWIAIWELFTNHVIPAPWSACSQGQAAKIEANVTELFLNNGVVENRRLFLQVAYDYYKQVAWMPGYLHNVKILLYRLRAQLVLGYQKFEASFPSTKTEICDGLQEEFQRLFAECRNSTRDIMIIPSENVDQRLRSSRKSAVDATSGSRSKADVRWNKNRAMSSRETKNEGPGGPTQYASEPLYRKGKRKRSEHDNFTVSGRPHRIERHDIQVF